MPPWLATIFGSGIIDKIFSFIPNPEQARQAKAELQELLIKSAIDAESEQRQIDKAEAASPSLFVAGWRPAVGWLCVFGLGWQFFGAPLLTWFSMALHIPVPPLPVMGDSTLNDLLYALLGIGTLRTVDKFNGVDTRSVGDSGAAITVRALPAPHPLQGP